MDSLIYIAPSRSSFVLLDIDNLSRQAKVTPYFFDVKHKILLPWYLTRLFLVLLFKPKQNVLISFGGYHSFVATLVARLKGVKSYIILNGVDSANLPEYQYGYLRGGAIGWFCEKSYQWATELLPVSESLMRTTAHYGFKTPKELGLKKEFPTQEFNYQVLPNGFDLDFWKPVSEKEVGSFLTVVGSSKRINLKGLDLILEVAPLFPECTFYVVGLDHIENKPENVTMLGYLNPDQLRDAYSKTQFYFQLSIWEAFGCALCEAMLCGCIPIGSSANMIPEIIGETGYLLEKKDVTKLKDVIVNALAHMDKENMSKASRERIYEEYPIGKRISTLISLLQK